MPSINLVTVPDQYSDSAGTLYCPNSKSITVQVFNANVFYQLAIATAGVSSRQGAEVWGPETVLSPGYWNFDQSDFMGGICHGIRFRNVVAGTAGRVTANA